MPNDKTLLDSIRLELAVLAPQTKLDNSASAPVIQPMKEVQNTKE